MKRYLKQMSVRRDLLLYLVTSGLRAQHRNSFLGYFWWLLDPLLGVVIYYFVVAIVFRRGGGDYVLSLVIGMIVWRFLQSAVVGGTKSIVSQAGIISQVYLPKAIFPVGGVLTQLINFGFGLVVVALFLVAHRHLPGWSVLWLPVIILIQLVMVTAITLVVAYVGAFVRDMDNLINHLMRIWFYGSPIIWSENIVSERWRWVLTANPMTYILSGYKNALLYDMAPNIPALCVIGLAYLVVVLAMLWVYSEHEHRIIKVL